MPDTTNPAAPGPQTSEFGFAKIVQLAGVVVASASGILAGVATIFETLHHSFPQAAWVTAGLGLVGGLAALTKSASGYASSRGDVKTAMINLQSAQVMAANQPRNP